jgi:uncharacterized protein (DUF2249 family)
MALASYGTRIDLRDIPARDRHALVERTYGILERGQTLDLLSDQDPGALFHHLQERHPSGFGWDYLERGPALWRVRVLRLVSQPTRSVEGGQ